MASKQMKNTMINPKNIMQNHKYYLSATAQLQKVVYLDNNKDRIYIGPMLLTAPLSMVLHRDR
jgi:hypothetical protein